MRRSLLLAVLIASTVGLGQTIVIPTGPFCDDCIITNMTFYDVGSVDSWRIDAESTVHSIRANVSAAQSEVSLLLGGDTYYVGIHHCQTLLDGIIDDVLESGDESFDPTNYHWYDDLHTLDNYLNRVEQRAYSLQSDLNVIDSRLSGLEDYLVNDIPDYRARFATACVSGGGTNVCCECPDYTPYFVKLTNDVSWIRGYTANIETFLHTFYDVFSSVEGYFAGAGWPMDDVFYTLLLSRLAQLNLGYPEIVNAFADNVYGNPLFSYPIATSSVFSNFVSAIRLPSDDSTMPFEDSWSSFQSDISPSGLSTNLLWDRLTLPLFDLDAFLHWHLGQDQTYKDYKTIYGPSEAYWSLPNATAGVMSNFWESVHEHTEGRMGPSLVTYHNLLVLTNTVAQLEKMPVLDRITLLLWRIAKGGDDDNTNSPPDHLSSEIEDHDDADEIRAISWDTEDTSTASEQVSGILSGLRTLKSSISGTPDSTVRISGFSFPTIFGFTSPGFTTQSFRLADEGPLSTIYPIVRRVFILAWTLCMCWVVYRVAVFYLLLFGRVIAVLWPLLHGDMVKTAEAVHKVFDLTIFKAARFASFMGDFIESDASSYSWYGRDL